VSTGKFAFKETDVARAIRAAQKANLTAFSVRITRDVITIITDQPQVDPAAVEWRVSVPIPSSQPEEAAR
jgi:hypothetical protein